MENEILKPTVCPNVLVKHDDKNEGLDVEVDLPAVDKNKIDLTLGESGFCVYAERDDEKYEGCFHLAHLVNKNKAKAKYENGLLKFNVPFKESIKEKKIRIE